MTATKFDNAMTAHVWAQQTQRSGESHNGNLWFQDRIIYSYGRHFPLAAFAADGVTVFVNSDSSSNTTNGKHKPAVSRALGYDRANMFRVPSLGALLIVIESANAAGLIPASYRGARDTALRYLEEHWLSFPADSAAATWLLRAAGSRAQWGAMRGRLESAAKRVAETNAKRAKRHAIARGKELAAIPLDMVRLRMIQSATSGNDWNRERNLNDSVAEYADAHRASNPGKVRDALWARVKLARELRDRFLRRSGKAFAARRGAIATLRRIWAGDYEAPDAYNVALAERTAIGDASTAHAPAALRVKASARLAELNVTIAELERQRESARMAAQAAQREAWLSNAADAPRYAYDLKDERGGALVRAIDVEMSGCNVTAGTLETSQGATVPLVHAVRAFAFVRAIRERGADWTRNGSGLRVGHFQVDRVESSGDFVAGCHRINWNETERLARELGIWDCPATELVDDMAELPA